MQQSHYKDMGELFSDLALEDQQKNMEKVLYPKKYKFYATLLDAYQWYLNSEQDEAFQDFINKINRVPFQSEAAEKGTAFNELVDADKSLKGVTVEKETVKYKGFDFKRGLLNEFIGYFKSAIPQVFISSQLETNKGLVELYGYADKVLQDTCFDIKTTSKYEFPKFINNWQHKVYPYCFNCNGIFIDRFEYTVTDFNNIYKESYVWNPVKDLRGLMSICESLIDFIELHRELITDRKIFGLPKEEILT